MPPWVRRGGLSPAASLPAPSCTVDSPELLREIARAVATEMASAGKFAHNAPHPGRSPLTLALLTFFLGAATVALIVALSLWGRYHDMVVEQSTKLTRETSPAALRRLFGGELPVWLSSPEAYGAPWMNEVTKALWPYIRVAGAAWATNEDGLGKLMRETTFWKPPWLSGLAIRIRAVDLGVTTPVVNGVHVHQTLPDDDRIVMDFEFSWRSKLSTLLTIMPLGEARRKKPKSKKNGRDAPASPRPTGEGANSPLRGSSPPGGASPARSTTPTGAAASGGVKGAGATNDKRAANGAVFSPGANGTARGAPGAPRAAPTAAFPPADPSSTAPPPQRASSPAPSGMRPMSDEDDACPSEETPGPRGLMWFVAHFLRIGAQISDLVVDGTIRAELRPLMNDVPVVGAVKVSLLRAPRFTYRVASLGINPMFLPGLEAMISSFINSTVLAPMTYPEGIEIPLLPEEWSNGVAVQQANDLPRGVLSVTVVRALHVPRMDILGWADPYVAVSVRDSEVFNTSVRSRTAEPVWNETFHLSVVDPTVQALQLVMLEQDIMRSEEIGRIQVPLAPLIEALTADEVSGRANLSARGAPSISAASASSGEMRSPFAFAFKNGKANGAAAGATKDEGFGAGAGLTPGTRLGRGASAGAGKPHDAAPTPLRPGSSTGNGDARLVSSSGVSPPRQPHGHLPNAHSASRSGRPDPRPATPRVAGVAPGASQSPSPRRPRVPVELRSGLECTSSASSEEVAAIGGSVVGAHPSLSEERSLPRGWQRNATPGKRGAAERPQLAVLGTEPGPGVEPECVTGPSRSFGAPEREGTEGPVSSLHPTGPALLSEPPNGAAHSLRVIDAAAPQHPKDHALAAPTSAGVAEAPPLDSAALRPSASVSFAVPPSPGVPPALVSPAAPTPPPLVGGPLDSIGENSEYMPASVRRGVPSATIRSPPSAATSVALSDASERSRRRRRSAEAHGFGLEPQYWKSAKTWWKEARSSLYDATIMPSKSGAHVRMSTLRDLFRPSQEPPPPPERPPEPDPIRRAEAAMHGVDFWIDVPQSRKHKVLSDDFARKFSERAEESLRTALHNAALPPGTAGKERGGLESLGRMAQEKTDYLARIFGAKSGDAVRLKLRLAYTRFDMRDLREIADEADRTPGRSLPHNSMLRNIFRGGVLQIKLDRADDLTANKLEGFVNDMCAWANVRTASARGGRRERRFGIAPA